MIKLLKVIKWGVIYCLVFMAAVLAVPYFLMSAWLDQPSSDSFAKYIGKLLVAKVIEDFNA